MVTTRAGTTAAPAPAAAAAAPVHPQGQVQWKYGGDNRVSWAPLRADLNDLVEAAWQ